MATTFMIVTMVFNIITLVYDIKFGLNPYRNWNFVHKGFSKINTFTLDIMNKSISLQTTYLEIFWLVPPIISYGFFIFLGLGAESRKEYRLWYNYIKKVFIIIYGSITGKVFKKSDTSRPSTYEFNSFDTHEISSKEMTENTGEDFEFDIHFLRESQDSYYKV